MGSKQRILADCPVWDEYTGAFITDPRIGTLAQSDILRLDMGSVDISAGAANSEAKGLVARFTAGFEDTVFGKPRMWIINHPTFGGHKFAAEFETAATFPAISLDAVLAGPTAADLKGNPYDTLHKPLFGTVYDAATKEFANLLLQVQIDATSRAWNGLESFHGCPTVVLEFPRADAAIGQLEPELMHLDEVQGHLQCYAERLIFFNSGDGNWQQIAAINDSDVKMQAEDEYLEWGRGVPKAPFVEAISTRNAMLDFTTNELPPALIALALQTNASSNAIDDTVDVKSFARLCQQGVLTGQWIMQKQTFGGIIIREFIDRGRLSFGGVSGGDQFETYSFNVKSLVDGPNRTVYRKRYTQTPVEFVQLQVPYAVTT